MVETSREPERRRRATQRSAPGPRSSAELTAEEHRTRERLLTQAHPSRIAGTVDAVVLEEGGVFLLTARSGDVPFDSPHALGLYLDDCRYLDGLVLTVGGKSPVLLSSADTRGFETIHHLANPELEDALAGARVPANSLSIQRRRCIHGGTVYEEIAIQNHGDARVSLPAELSFRARFEDIFAVKKFTADSGAARSLARALGRDLIELQRRGRDGLRRRTWVRFAEPPDSLEPRRARFDLELEPGACRRIQFSIEPFAGDAEIVRARRLSSPESIRQQLAAAPERPDALPRFRSSSGLFDRVLRRAVLDLGLLYSEVEGRPYFAAGIPWFATLFGRDAALVALQTLPWGSGTARETLQLLARYQATEYDAFRDAAPGKILHELRRGELARLGVIPQSPAYYGTIDATPLFLILLCAYVRWSGDLDLAHALRPNAERALDWMAREIGSEGFLSYAGAYETGLVNQGWKDSGDAIVDADGNCAEPPIALCEVQGYVYRAWRDVALLWRELGAQDEARALEERAAQLRVRFEREFWSDSLGCYVLARQARGRAASVVSSNAGQVLWTGIAHPERAARVAQRMLAPDMFSGWGVRTLSADDRAYNPMSYHRGSVWPHDNALILAGLRRYGHDDAALRLFEALFSAASWCRNDRLPELFCGFPRTEREGAPVPYPVACSPQAWAAGALPHALWTLLGLLPDAAHKRLILCRPRLPLGLDALEVLHVRVGAAEVDLRIRRAGEGELEIDADVRGDDLDVVREEQVWADA